MPSALLRPCPGDGGHCPELVTSGRCRVHAVVREHERDNFEIRRWYRTAKWKAIRARVLREEPFCLECQAETGRVVPNTDVHHKQKHHGDRALFFDRANLEGKCHPHHSRHTARGE